MCRRCYRVPPYVGYLAGLVLTFLVGLALVGFIAYLDKSY